MKGRNETLIRLAGDTIERHTRRMNTEREERRWRWRKLSDRRDGSGSHKLQPVTGA